MKMIGKRADPFDEALQTSRRFHHQLLAIGYWLFSG
jgi:hypothetical protein